MADQTERSGVAVERAIIMAHPPSIMKGVAPYARGRIPDPPPLEALHSKKARAPLWKRGPFAGRDSDQRAGICCEMQWKLPPPVRIASARRPTT